MDPESPQPETAGPVPVASAPVENISAQTAFDPHYTQPIVPLHRDLDKESGWIESAQSLAATIVVALFIITFLMQTFQIPSPSMENSLLVGDFLLVDKLQFGQGLKVPLLPYRDIQRTNIVVFHWPVHPEQHFVKRVIGIPGDRIRLSAGRVYVNGEVLVEPYVLYKRKNNEAFRYFRDYFPAGAPMDTQVTSVWAADMAKLVRNGELVVPEDHYFVLGDNRNDSLDSRYWGLVPRESIIGRPLLVYWSLRQWGDGTGGAQAHSGGEPDDDRITNAGTFFGRVSNFVRWERTLHFVP